MPGGHNETFYYRRFGSGAAKYAFLVPKSTQEQYTRARRWPRAAQNGLTEEKPNPCSGAHRGLGHPLGQAGASKPPTPPRCESHAAGL